MLKVVLVGRPNVGKSTLFNRLVRSQKAIVNDQPGVTRDRKYGQGKLADLEFTLIDTAGIDDSLKGSTEMKIKKQSQLAIDDANVIFDFGIAMVLLIMMILKILYGRWKN